MKTNGRKELFCHIQYCVHYAISIKESRSKRSSCNSVFTSMYYVKCLVDFCSVPESDESSDNFSNESSEDDEDKESDEISIYFCAVLKLFCSFACSIVALQIFDIQEIVAPYSYTLPFQLVSFVLLLLIVLY